MDEPFSKNHFELIHQGLKLFNEEKYWECHEELEDHWMEDQTDPIRYIYWAIIQVATALYHYRDKNLSGALGMILKAQKKIQKVEDLGLETETLDELLNWNQFKSLTNSLQKDSTLDEFEKLSTFRFKL